MSLVSPAPLAAVFALYAEDPVPPGLQKFAANPRALIIAHVAAGRSWLLTDAKGRPVAAGGLVPSGGALEAWFVAGHRAPKAILPIVRAAQLTFARIADAAPVKIRARIARGWRLGQRLARLLRMTPTGAEELGMEIWEFGP